VPQYRGPANYYFNVLKFNYKTQVNKYDIKPLFKLIIVLYCYLECSVYQKMFILY